jgi:hypothetical protein
MAAWVVDRTRLLEASRAQPDLAITSVGLFARRLRAALARLGASESTVSRILGHKAIAGTIAVSVTYDRFDRLREIRAALVAWASYVETLVTCEDTRGEIVAFGRASARSRPMSTRERPALGRQVSAYNQAKGAS